jgi:hypothetical protein
MVPEVGADLSRARLRYVFVPRPVGVMLPTGRGS